MTTKNNKHKSETKSETNKKQMKRKNIRNNTLLQKNKQTKQKQMTKKMKACCFWDEMQAMVRATASQNFASRIYEFQLTQRTVVSNL